MQAVQEAAAATAATSQASLTDLRGQVAEARHGAELVHMSLLDMQRRAEAARLALAAEGAGSHGYCSAHSPFHLFPTPLPSSPLPPASTLDPPIPPLPTPLHTPNKLAYHFSSPLHSPSTVPGSPERATLQNPRDADSCSTDVLDLIQGLVEHAHESKQRLAAHADELQVCQSHPC